MIANDSDKFDKDVPDAQNDKLSEATDSSDATGADEEFMLAAIEQARIAGAAGDVPVGAIVVVDNQIIAKGHNERQVSFDPTAHAEIVALRQAAKTIGNWRIEGTLYVTQEPCPMCAGALVNARTARLVYGCANPKAGAVDSLYQLVTDERLNHRMVVTRDVLRDQCARLLKDFFAALRAKH